MEQQKFGIGQRVVCKSDFYGNRHGEIIAVVGTPLGWFYTVNLDDECSGGLNGKVVQLMDLSMEKEVG